MTSPPQLNRPVPRHGAAAALLRKLAAATAAGTGGPRVTLERAAEIKSARPSDPLTVATMASPDGSLVENPRDLRMVVEHVAHTLGVRLALAPEALLSAAAMQTNLAALEGAAADAQRRVRNLFADHRRALLAQTERGAPSASELESMQDTARWAERNQLDPAQVAAVLAEIHAEVSAIECALGDVYRDALADLFAPSAAAVADALRTRAASPAFWLRAVPSGDVGERLCALAQLKATAGDLDVDASRRAGADAYLAAGEVVLAERALAGSETAPALPLDVTEAAAGAARRLRDSATPLPHAARFMEGLQRPGVASTHVCAALSERCEAVLVRHVASAGAADLLELRALVDGVTPDAPAAGALRRALQDGAVAAVSSAQRDNLTPHPEARAACAVVLATSVLPFAQSLVRDPATRAALAASVDAHLARCGDALLVAMTSEDALPQAPAFQGGSVLGSFLGLSLGLGVGRALGAGPAETAPIPAPARAAFLGAVRQALAEDAKSAHPRTRERARLTQLADVLASSLEGITVPRFGPEDIRFAHHDVRQVLADHLAVTSSEVDGALKTFFKALRPNSAEAALLNAGQLSRAVTEAVDSVVRAHRGDADRARVLRGVLHDAFVEALRAGIPGLAL